MDLFVYWPECKVLICRECKYAVPPDGLNPHLRRFHKDDHVDLCVHQGPAAVAKKLLSQPNKPLMDPKKEKIAIPAHKIDAHPFLDLHSGYQCNMCPQILCTTKGIREHVRIEHNIVRRGPGRPTSNSPYSVQDWTSVMCQRVFVSGCQSKYFAVYSPEETKTRKMIEQDGQEPKGKAPGAVPPAIEDLVRAEIFGQLAVHRERHQAADSIIAKETDKTEVSPWLELTRWSTYLSGHSLPGVARLGALPVHSSESLLEILCESIDRLVDSAHRSVCEDRINAFDQMRINSFLQRPRAADKPLMVKLQKSTYKRYSSIWKRLLCFVHRTMQPCQRLQLQHRLTPTQITHYDRMMMSAEVTLHDKLRSGVASGAAELSSLDYNCLQFCVSLLDHDLKASIFESSILGFLAVLGIDEVKGILREAYHYTPMLSGFIKISQLFVIQLAVHNAEAEIIAHPADLLDEFRERFMIHGTRSPFSWACRLRMYGKKVRDSTTCLGYISWTDDSQYVSYKNINNFGMQHFRDFVRAQVSNAQMKFEELLILHPEEKREEMGIAFQMHRLVDNAAESARGWSFLQDNRNLEGELPDRKDWMLNRIIENNWLRDEFIDTSASGKIVWNQRAVCSYGEKVNDFLKHLLLLVHLTSGQPARGTELLSLRHSNTMQGHHRNIFIENGMVSTVTSWHKGYTVTGSTKIIHRYLPKQVGELVVYYLWLILPFWRELEVLALRRDAPPSPFLWPKPHCQGPWHNRKLGEIMRETFKRELGLEMTIPYYRHLAIAISRKHLRCGGFQRDYGLEDTKFDTQSAHSTWTAGSIYARGLQEAAGHVEGRKEVYRAVSREWHDFLGFTSASLPARKRTLLGIGNEKSLSLKRRKVHGE